MSTKKKPDAVVVDPLEAAKVSTEAKAPAKEVLPEPEKAPVTSAKKSKKKESPPEVPKAVVPKPIYMVLNDVSLSWHGQIIRLKKGGNVSESTHGPGFHEAMTNAGVALEEVKA